MKKRALFLILLLSFTLYCLSQSTSLDETETEINDYIVSVNEKLTSEFFQQIQVEKGAKLKKRIGQDRVAIVQMDSSLFEKLSKWSSVINIERNHKYKAHNYYNEYALNLQSVDLTLWNLDVISKPNFNSYNNLYEYNYTGNGVDVYVFDTGVKLSHQEFQGRAKLFRSYTGSSCEDCDGHGTHVAGTVAGKTYGVSKQANILAVQVLGDDGLGDLGDIIESLYDVSNVVKKKSIGVMSLGGPVSFSMNQAVKYARQKGLYVAVSAGNDNFDACYSSPADSPDAVTVAAHDKVGRRATFSNFGQCVDVYAPGVSIKSASSASETGSRVLSGTSMAAPHVAGLMALMLEQNPDLGFFEIEDLLKKNVKEDFMEIDAPAVISYTNVSPCPGYCIHSYVTLPPRTVLVTLNQNINILNDGILKGWLYNTQSNDNSQFFSLSVANVSSSTNSFNAGYPLYSQSNVEAGKSYNFVIKHTSSSTTSQPGGNFSLFYEVPTKCSAANNCNSKGTCDSNGDCMCFSAYYGENCSESRTVLLFNYGTTTGSVMFLTLSLFFFTSNLNCMRKNRVSEIN